VDGVLQLDAVADELVHEQFTCDTRDHEDHTFCGMMFDVACESELPVEYVEIQSVSVRGDLGPLTVWTTPDTFLDKHESQEEWTQLYEAVHSPSRNQMVELKFNEPIKLRPGERRGMYVHSALPGDEAIVYDNQRAVVTYQDKTFKVLPGLAHLSNKPFGKRGFWGRPWRMNREFVGRVQYGVRWKMWSPDNHLGFPLGFRRAVTTMMIGSRRPESLLYLLQDEIVLFIMNKCWWSWWGENLHEETPAAGPSSSRADARAQGPGGTFSGGYTGPSRAFSGGTHSSLYASLLGSMHGHHLASFTPTAQLGGHGLGVFDSESDDEYDYMAETSENEEEGEEEEDEDENEDEEEDVVDEEEEDEDEVEELEAEASAPDVATCSDEQQQQQPLLPWKQGDELGETSPQSVTDPLMS